MDCSFDLRLHVLEVRNATAKAEFNNMYLACAIKKCDKLLKVTNGNLKECEPIDSVASALLTDRVDVFKFNR